MQSVTKVYYVRHAEPNYDNHNDALRELSPKGLNDRKLVTKFLADKEINVAVSSPFRRAVDTIKEFADLEGIKIELIDEFHERKVDSGWIDDFTSFTQKQWDDFNYKLPDGECLQEVQERNVSALLKLIEHYKGKNIVIGGHGTALSTIINYFDASFGYEDAYVNWHCPNEHFTIDEYIIANCEYPGEWDGIVERVEMINDLIITVTQIYPKDKSISFHVTSFIQMKDDKIIAIDEYYADDSAAPQWRLDKHIGTFIK